MPENAIAFSGIKTCLKDQLKQGKKVVLYFYPKDNTPGCTTEACDFRDSFNRILEKAVVAGVSRDSVSNHKNFREKHSLNFPLLSDPDHKVHEAYDKVKGHVDEVLNEL